jgi:hypothetical protein
MAKGMGLPIAGYSCSTMVPSKSTAITMGFLHLINNSLYQGAKIAKNEGLSSGM